MEFICKEFWGDDNEFIGGFPNLMLTLAGVLYFVLN